MHVYSTVMYLLEYAKIFMLSSLGLKMHKLNASLPSGMQCRQPSPLTGLHLKGGPFAKLATMLQRSIALDNLLRFCGLRLRSHRNPSLSI